MVYNRLKNLQAWMECWRNADHNGAKLLVINNYDNVIDQDYYQVSSGNCDWFAYRHNLGMDMGAFQDLINDRIEGFSYHVYHWDAVFWVSDDTFPLTANFLEPFLTLLANSNTGAVGPQVSSEYSYHLRTNCFCVRHEHALQFKFPRKKMRSKMDCYEFEHRGNTLTSQLKRLGLGVSQPAESISAYMWDTGHYLHLDLWDRLYAAFPTIKGIIP